MNKTHTTPTDAVLALSTCPPEDAERLAAGLVNARLAACVNLLPGVRSIYRWEGQLEQAEETLMVIKTTTFCWEQLAGWLAQHHPYDVPELISVDLTNGLPDYLQWIDQQTMQADRA
ncbi:MAG: divalent-cation tolerance protein CutA [Pseudomonadota bacterium]